MTDMPDCRVEVAWQTPPRTRPDDISFTRIDRAESLLSLPGSAGAYASTPDAAALDIVGDIDVRVEATLTDWTPAAIGVLAAKWVAAFSQRSYRLRIDTTGALRFAWSVDGSATIERTSTATLAAIAPGTRLHVRATLAVIGGAVNRVGFYTSTDGTVWEQLGDFVDNLGATSIFVSAAPLEVGSSDAGTVGLLAGSVHSAQVRSGVDGTIVAEPSFRAQTPGDTSFTDGAGLVWTVHGGASIIEDPAAGAVALRKLTTKRGARLKVAELEAGDATALFENTGRQLDPSNAASPWAPNVKPRRRIRFVLEPEGEADRIAWTGFIDRLPIGWEVGDGWVELTAYDLLGLIAGDTLPPSVLHKVIVDSAPVAYWPLTETSGQLVDDVVGVQDGRAEFAVEEDRVTPFAPGGHKFSGRTIDGTLSRSIATRLSHSTTEWAFGMWFKALVIEAVPQPVLVTMAADEGDLLDNTVHVWVNTDNVSSSGDRGSIGAYWDDSAGTWSTDSVVDVLDGHPHYVVIQSNGSALEIWVDGIDVSLAGPINVGAPTAIGPAEVRFGWRPVDDATTTADAELTWAKGHIAYYDRTLSAAEQADIYAAGVAPWDGDRTDERMARVLDAIGIDAADLDLDAGTVYLGPATLDGGNVVEYLRKIVATDPGAAIFVTADGKLAFRTAVANEPTPLATFVGDPDIDTGTPYTDVTPGYSLDRVVNVAEVTRENGVTQRTENADSIDEYGPLAVQLATLHRTASGARGAGARLTNRYRDPRLVLEALELNARRDDVTPAVTLDLDVNDPVQVIARPTGGGDPIDQTGVLESITHELDWQARTWDVGMGLAEHVTLPIFAFDTDGQGWDEAVWAAT